MENGGNRGIAPTVFNSNLKLYFTYRYTFYRKPSAADFIGHAF